MKVFLKLRPKLHESRYRRLWEDCLDYATNSAKNLPRQECHNMIQEIRHMGEANKTRYVIDEYYDEGLAQGEARDKANSILSCSQDQSWPCAEIDL